MNKTAMDCCAEDWRTRVEALKLRIVESLGAKKSATVDGKSYGWLGLAITGDIKSKLLAAHKLIDKKDLNSDGCDKDPHVTLAYGLDAKQNPKQVERIIADSKAVKIKLGPLSAFKHDDQTVLKFDIISPQLKALNAKVKSGIKLPGNSYSTFKPHITVAYCKPGTSVAKYKKLERGLKGKTQKLDAVEYRDAGDKSREYELKAASITLDIEKGDTLLGGRFKNHKTIVRDIGTDELGQPTINGMKLLSFRIAKNMPAKTAAYMQGFMTKSSSIFVQ